MHYNIRIDNEINEIFETILVSLYIEKLAKYDELFRTRPTVEYTYEYFIKVAALLLLFFSGTFHSKGLQILEN